MKALSIKQPWAWAYLNAKPVENRDKRTSHRGPLFVHASKTFDFDGWSWIILNHKKLGISLADMPQQFEDYPTGGLVGIVDVVDCVTEHDSPWFFGPYGYVRENPRAIEYIPFRGMPGLFEVPSEIVGRVAFSMAGDAAQYAAKIMLKSRNEQ